jgi:hypothetical protein
MPAKSARGREPAAAERSHQIVMDDQYRRLLNALLKAPWAGQPVRPFVRGLAWLVVGLGTVSLALAAFFVGVEGIPREDLAFVALAFFGILYMVLLFGRAAYSGRAPRGWLPWS